MATLILDKSNLELTTQGAALVFYENGERRSSLPIKSIERCIMIGSTIKLDASVIQKIVESGGSMLMLSARFQHRTAFVLGNKHNDVFIRVEQAIRLLDAQWPVTWSKVVVMTKLRQQLKCLQRLMNARPEHRHALFVARERIRQQYIELLSANMQAHNVKEKNACLSRLRGIEGSASRQWFSTLVAILPQALRFRCRNRRPPRDPVNSLMSLSYTLVHFEAIRAAHMAGLDPLIGFYHQPAYGRESLASDLIESLRPDIDLFVVRLLAEQQLRAEDFGLEQNGACLLKKSGRSKFFEQWEKQVKFYRRYLRLYCRRTAAVFKQKQVRPFSFDVMGDEDEAFESF
ncbi:CRISPR-associated endonuclease Cas1 [Oligella sp. MSHR50489EDL]|uniref:CRISPR-associated endonuclease Cas1 n=1 Tax=Oligella sp. MSHR50489EDL TaxID=3139409 RepID=UPI003D81B936